MLNKCLWHCLLTEEKVLCFLRFPMAQTPGLEHSTTQRPCTALQGILETVAGCIILYAWHNYNVGFCLPWCQSVSKHTPHLRFACAQHWGCPLTTTGICEPLQPRVSCLGQPGRLFPREDDQQWASESWRKKRKGTDEGQLGLHPMGNSDQVFF